MKSFCKTLLILFTLLACDYGVWAQPWYINQLLLLGHDDENINHYIEIYLNNGLDSINYNLNKGAGGQNIYLFYETTYDNITHPAITDFYLKSTNDKDDHPNDITYNNRTYHRVANVVGSESFMNSYGDLNDGAGGKYIYLYYTTDGWDYPRGITTITFSGNSYGAVCGNGTTTPQNLNEGAGGENIYMHYGYTLTTEVVDVREQYDFAPLNAHSDQPLHFRIADDVVNGYLATISNVVVGNGNIATIDLNGKGFQRNIQSGDSGNDNGHVIKVIDNSSLTIVDNSANCSGSIAGGNADKGGAFYVAAGSSLTIESGTIQYCHADYGGAIYNLGTLTINGGTIQSCTATRGQGRAIIYNNGNLTINGGVIQNNTAYYGGAIYNVNGWTTTINGGAIQNNNATGDGYNIIGIGGGIANEGTLRINGGSIIGNTSASNGGGIYANVDDRGAVFMKGNPVIRDNKMGSVANNVYIPNENKVINVEGAFTVGACIGFTPQSADDRITNNYSEHNNGIDPASYFFSDNGYFIKLNGNGEVIQDQSISVVGANYIDAESNEAYYSNCFPLSGITDESGVTLTGGWYLLDANKDFNNRINVNGDVNIILGDDYQLFAKAGIEMVNDNNSLTIYCQSGHTGRLLSYGETGNAGKGTITINGGYFTTNYGINANAINLNWTDYSVNTAEQIAAIYYNGTVTLQKYFTDGTTVYNAGVVADNGTLGNKILKPYTVYDVNIGTIENGSFTATPSAQHDGLTVTLTGIPADAEHPLCSEITVTGVTTGDNIAVTRDGKTNNFTFVMPREAVNVTAKFEDKVLADYLDYYGEIQQVPAIKITSGSYDLELDNGWYVVDEDVTTYHNCIVKGDDVNIILCDGITYSFDNQEENPKTIQINDKKHLKIWGQSLGTGRLYAETIGNSDQYCDYTLTLYGGVIEAYTSGSTVSIVGGSDVDVVLSGGHIAVSSYAGNVIFERFYEDPDGTKYYGEHWQPSELSAMANKLLFPCDKVFVKEGDWNVASNWLDNSMPGYIDYVTLRNGATVPNGCLAQVKDIMAAAGGSITIKDGGQFYISPGRDMAFNVTVEKNISAADGAAQTNWYLLSSPVYYDYYYDPYTDANYYFALIANVSNLTEGAYDMFRYYEPEHKWQNKKVHGDAGFQVMDRGRGYLYRNGADQTIAFTGTMTYGYINSWNYLLSYTVFNDDYAALSGFNLIGNPYTHNIKKGTPDVSDSDISINNNDNHLQTGFYKLADYGQWTACTDNTVIGVGEAILVQATSEANGQCLAFDDKLAASSKARSNNDNIMFTVANSQYSDVTYALFEEGHGLTKINHRNAEIPMIYIPKNGENMAIATMSDNTKMFPLNFKAMTMGSYTISCTPEGDFNYLHLVDRLTGEDVDLLLENEYSFIGAPSDSEVRFIVKLEYSDGSDNSKNSVFAYQNGNEIIVDGEGTLQVFDVMGRVVATMDVNGVQSINGMPKGVYIFRLNEKTQKIVVR